MTLITTTEKGTVITVSPSREGNHVVTLDHPDAPADMRGVLAGRIIDGGYQPAIFAAWAMSPDTLRALADLIEKTEN